MAVVKGRDGVVRRIRTGSRVVVLVFSSASAASRVVAGLPAAARALREVVLAGASRCTIAVSGGWMPDRRAQTELTRLAQAMPFTVIDTAELPDSDLPVLLVQGEHPVGAARLRVALSDKEAGVSAAWSAASSGALLVAPAREWLRLPHLSPGQAEAMLDRASKAIIAATSKPGDGIVSQLINRPISQAISRFMLRFVGISPFVATAAAAALAVAMLASLFFFGPAGLIAGAVFYQLASIVDGVDGEIARATFRSSKAGAMADSLVDAITNIGFIAGLDINLWIQGNARAAIAGSAGLGIVALGLFLVGRRGRKNENGLTFDAVKHQLNERPSWFRQILIWLTMRDFFAFAWLIGIIAGVAAPGLVLFSFGAAIWLVVVVLLLRPQAT